MPATELQYKWRDPDVYQSFMGRWSELLAPKFLALTGIPDDARVLDVACGTGVLSKALADSGRNVIAIDVSEGFLEGARQLRSHPNVTYDTGDIRKMTFPDGTFDAAVSTLALDVLPETEQVVAEMKRVVRPGGVVASAVHQFLGGLPAFDLLIHTASVLDADIRELRSTRAGRQRFWPGGQTAMWRAAGLVDVVESPIVIDCEYPSFADYWGTFTSGMASFSPRLMALTDDARNEIQKHVRAGYLLGWADGPRSFPMIARAVRGTVPK
jgi:SAM-dependent methyltransferase